ncbi:hypothetical protein Tco_0977837 [Tanacetum coccineum]|uniref:F-box domain-containing protein n=1 Tax=Tanacetum coccineum TaxID=301880 RepID=A0ABQ5ELB3_9ASTR
MDNGEVAVASMGIHKADRQNDIPNANHNAVNQVICGSANDPMIGRSAKVNDHPTVDIGVKPVPVDEFADDFVVVLNDEESIPNYSLDDIKLQDEEEKLISTPTHVNHQQVDEFIDVHEDKTTILQENVKRKKRLAMALDSPFGQQVTTTPAPPKTISRSVNGDFIAPPEFLEVDGCGILRAPEIPTHVEEDSQSPGAYQWNFCALPPAGSSMAGFIIVMVEIDMYLGGASLDCVCNHAMAGAGHQFIMFSPMAPLISWRCVPMAWDSVFGDDDVTAFHLDLWIDLMWYFREPDTNYAMVSPHFLTCTLGGSMIDYYSNGVRYLVAWRDVEKTSSEVFAPVKSLLQFRTVSKSWKSCIDSSAFLFKYGVRKSLNDVFYLTYNHGFQGSMICVDDNLIHTPALTNLHIVNLKPIGTSHGVWCFSYGNNMMVCIANPSIKKEVGVFVPTSQPDSCKILLGFGVHPENLDPTVVKISYPSSVEGNWSVYVFTLSSLRWDQLDIKCLPCESIRFKRSTQAVVGQFIYWVGHERVLADSGDSYKHYLLVSFDMINHRFQVIDIPDLLMRGLSLSINGGSITSFPAIMTMPSHHFLKLLGFNNHDEPIVEAAIADIMGHTVQVYMKNSQSFENVAIQGNVGFWSGGLMSYVDLVKVFRHGM